ncbi:MAG TPA: MlaD family protein [Thermoanaerobaculia bacterium]|nr:MlaD family protein [Thermoanaerobaculia bacterium]
MPGEFQVGKRFRVGIVVLIALFAVMIGIFMVGQRAHLFVKKFPYETRFDSASGLVAGNPVRLNGVTVGNVLEVILSPDPADRTVRVVYDVDRRAAPRLRKGTRAAIKTIGLLGDKYIELEGGTAEEPEIEIGGTIPPAPGAGIEKLLEGGGDLIADLSGIARSLKNILARTEQGKGFLGALTTDSEESARLGNNLTATLTSLNSILRKVDAGQGLVGKLLIDQKYGKETGDSLQAAIRSVQNVFGKIDEGLRSNDGVLAALLTDPEGKKKVYTLLDNLTTAAGSLGNAVGQLEKGDGTLAILLRDEKFGKEFTQNLRSFSKSLDSIGRKLDSGQGTAGKLINDPAIFDAANHLVIGIDESRLLRWLIRNRQRAGIKKVYDREGGKPSPEVSEVSPAPAPPPQPTRRPSS